MAPPPSTRAPLRAGSSGKFTRPGAPGPAAAAIAERLAVERLIAANEQSADDPAGFCRAFGIDLAMFYWAARCRPRQLRLPAPAS